MKTQAGWYTDWIDPSQQRWFDGMYWSKETKPRSINEAWDLPKDFDVEAANAAIRSQVAPGAVSDGLNVASGAVYLVAGLIALGAVIGGIGLMIHSIPHCLVNPYDDSFVDCSQKTHPFIGVGAAVLIGGLLQAFTVAVVGRLCTVVSELRALQSATNRG